MRKATESKKVTGRAQKKEHILVIGGAGYIGSRLVPRLLEEGHSVEVVDTLWFGNHLPKKVRIVKKDAMHLEEKDLKGFTTVIFLAGLSNDPMAEFNPRMNFISNAPTPAYLAFLSKKAGVKRFVYAGSCSVYGFTEKECTEEDMPNAQSHYGVSKLQGEVGCLQYADDGFKVVALRQGTVSGYSPRTRFDLLVNTMYMTAATQNKIVVRNPAIWRPIFAISDAIEAYVLALKAPSGIYNVASKNVTLAEVALLVQDHFLRNHGKQIAIQMERISDARNYRVSIQKAKDVLKFHPKHSISSILEELDAHVGIDADFNDDAGYNIRVFEKL